MPRKPRGPLATPKYSWHRQPLETVKAFAIFNAYLTAGQNRTIAGTAKTVSLSRQYMTDLAKRWNWHQRALDYDAHLEEIHREAEIREEQKEAAIWAQHRVELRKVQFDLSEQFLDRVRKILDFPLSKKVVKRTDPDGKEIEVHIHPARWSLEGAGRLAEVGMKLRALALGEATDRVDHTGLAKVEVSTQMTPAMTDDQVRTLVKIIYEEGNAEPVAPGKPVDHPETPAAG